MAHTAPAFHALRLTVPSSPHSLQAAPDRPAALALPLSDWAGLPRDLLRLIAAAVPPVARFKALARMMATETAPGLRTLILRNVTADGYALNRLLIKDNYRLLVEAYAACGKALRVVRTEGLAQGGRSEASAGSRTLHLHSPLFASSLLLPCVLASSASSPPHGAPPERVGLRRRGCGGPGKRWRCGRAREKPKATTRAACVAVARFAPPPCRVRALNTLPASPWES